LFLMFFGPDVFQSAGYTECLSSRTRSQRMFCNTVANRSTTITITEITLLRPCRRNIPIGSPDGSVAPAKYSRRSLRFGRLAADGRTAIPYYRAQRAQ